MSSEFTIVDNRMNSLGIIVMVVMVGVRVYSHYYHHVQ